MSNHLKIEIDHLALGLTRSPMFMSVNVRSFFSNLLFCTLLCINAHTFWGVPVFGIIHLMMVHFSIREPNFLYLYAKAFVKTPPVLNYWYWGKTNSYLSW